MSLTLRSPEGVPYRFDPGALFLEFLTSGGPGAYARHEMLHEPEDLARWTALSRLELDLVETSPAELDDAKHLRAALWRLSADRAHDRTARPADLNVVNEAARRGPLIPEITGIGRRVWAPPVTGSQVISTIARDAVEVFTGPFAGRVRECGAGDCHLIFVDTSRPGRRRWCSMERCGNRQKVRTHRSRI